MWIWCIKWQMCTCSMWCSPCVYYLLSGAALIMFLSCCLSLLLSWRISSRSLTSPSSPPDATKKKKRGNISNSCMGRKRNQCTCGEKKKKDVWNTLTKNQEYLYWLGFVNKVSESNHCVINHHDLTCWSLTHLCPRDFWCPPAGLEPFEPAPSVSPLSSPSPSGPSSSLPELSSPQLLWPEDTNRILIWSVSGLKSFLPDATSFVVLFSSGRQKVQYLSVCNVEGLGQLGEVLIDVNCLQAPAVSGQTFVEWNGVALRRTHHTTKRNLETEIAAGQHY